MQSANFFKSLDSLNIKKDALILLNKLENLVKTKCDQIGPLTKLNFKTNEILQDTIYSDRVLISHADIGWDETRFNAAARLIAEGCSLYNSHNNTYPFISSVISLDKRAELTINAFNKDIATVTKSKLDLESENDNSAISDILKLPISQIPFDGIKNEIDTILQCALLGWENNKDNPGNLVKKFPTKKACMLTHVCLSSMENILQRYTSEQFFKMPHQLNADGSVIISIENAIMDQTLSLLQRSYTDSRMEQKPTSTKPTTISNTVTDNKKVPNDKITSLQPQLKIPAAPADIHEKEFQDELKDFETLPLDDTKIIGKCHWLLCHKYYDDNVIIEILSLLNAVKDRNKLNDIVSLIDNGSMSLLNRAIKFGSIILVETLLDMKVDANKKDDDFLYACHPSIAVYNNKKLDDETKIAMLDLLFNHDSKLESPFSTMASDYVMAYAETLKFGFFPFARHSVAAVHKVEKGPMPILDPDIIPSSIIGRDAKRNYPTKPT